MATPLNPYELPEGFTLDTEESSSSSLPEGFVLDEPQGEHHQTDTSSNLDERSLPQKIWDKGTRLVTQGTIGALQRFSLPYDLPVIAARKYGIATAPMELRQSIFSDIETLQEEKARGNWSPQHQEEYDALVELIKDPSKMKQFLPKEEDVPHFDVGSLIESGAKQLGVDLKPTGADEMALRWIGLIKDPTKASMLVKEGLNPKNVKEIIKALVPTGKEAFRGIGAGTAIQYAAEAELGPIGTMMGAILGDLVGGGAVGAAKGIGKFAQSPLTTSKQVSQSGIQLGKKGLAKGIAAFTPKDKVGLQKALLEDFKESGIQADAGTITGNSLVKWIQSTLAQSGLTGQPLEEFKNSLTKSIVSEYKNLADQLGESIYQSKFEAGEALKNGLKEARDIDYGMAQTLYRSAKNRGGDAQVPTVNVGSLLKELQESLEPGSLKSGEQKAVLDIIGKVKKDVLTPDGTSRSASIDALINDKIALNDVIDYEVQGGAKKLLKRVVGEIDKAISTHGEIDPTFAREWVQANAKFSQHAKLFRGKIISQALRTQDPSQIFSKMNTPHGINEIKKALSVTPEGRHLYNQLARYKLDEIVGNNMVNSTTQQLNFGGFSKLLEKGQNRQIVKTLLGEEGFTRLERLQKNSGRLAETAQKFLNTSRSGVHATDLAFGGKIVMDIANMLSGNPWPLLKSGGILVSAKTASKLLTDPEFLKLLEEAVVESRSGSSEALKNAALRIANKAKALQEPTAAAVQSSNS